MDEIFDDADYLPKILFSGSPAPVPVTEIEIFEFVAGRPPDGYVFGRDAGVPVKSGQSVGHDLQNDVPVFEFVEISPQAAVGVEKGREDGAVQRHLLVSQRPPAGRPPPARPAGESEQFPPAEGAYRPPPNSRLSAQSAVTVDRRQTIFPVCVMPSIVIS